MTLQVLGLDIGGANLKAAHTDGSARSVAFPLWKNPRGLTAELQRLVECMPRHDRLAVTMTGELCDCFATKREGVLAIVQSVRGISGETPIRIWSTRGRFVSCEDASVAAANWLALAHLVGRQFARERVLLIDTGSTTTDIVYVNQGVPEPHGLSDPERLASGELVYTGVRRTPICAVLGAEVAAEFFATMLDAYLLLGLIPENPTDCDTADGRPATHAFAHARLARMRCADVEMFTAEEARQLAEHAISVQERAVQQAMERVAAGRPSVERIVVSGSGAILGRNVCAQQPGWSKSPLTSLTDLLGPALSESACAYAVAMLARDEREIG
ncbi:MAG: H4MPT-linked C1 transfer pathway protein [Gemmataceae bacterium]|nr:H4MPT-linked C1 transfer pathway protein [Gemmataceae bacterium]